MAEGRAQGEMADPGSWRAAARGASEPAREAQRGRRGVIKETANNLGTEDNDVEQHEVT
jgi:hypothetical protein